MKSKNLLLSFMLLLAAQSFFSCNTARHYDFANRSTAYHKSEAIIRSSESQVTENVNNKPISEGKHEGEIITSSASAEIVPLPVTPQVDLSSKNHERAQVVQNLSAENLKSVLSTSEINRQDLKKALKLYNKQIITNTQGLAQPKVDIVEVIFAILLPPVGVLLHEGGINTKFWISLVLTLLFFIPGIIYALLVVTDSI